MLGEAVSLDPCGKRGKVVFVAQQFGQFRHFWIERYQSLRQITDRAQIRLECLAGVVKVLLAAVIETAAALCQLFVEIVKSQRRLLRQIGRRQLQQLLGGLGHACGAPFDRCLGWSPSRRVCLLFEQTQNRGRRVALPFEFVPRIQPRDRVARFRQQPPDCLNLPGRAFLQPKQRKAAAQRFAELADRVNFLRDPPFGIEQAVQHSFHGCAACCELFPRKFGVLFAQRIHRHGLNHRSSHLSGTIV